MPSIAQQLRADRRRRARRRRAALWVVLAAAAAVLLARYLADAGAEPAGATPSTWATTPTVPPPPAPTITAAATGLRPGLVSAFERAQRAAADAGHDLTITSGFRTAAEQAALLDAEVEERGSLEEALWWVFPPDRSMHVQGLAIDVGDEDAAAWLEDEGAAYGLCRTLDWEWWHFEWRAIWESDRDCPTPAKTLEQALGR